MSCKLQFCHVKSKIMNQETINCSQQNLLEMPNINHPDVVTNLNISFNKISLLPVMNQFSNLRFLIISHNNFTNLTPLAALTQLVELDCSYNQLTSIDFIFSMAELQVFQCSNNNIKKIKPCFPRNIQSIDLSSNPIKSLAFIENSGLTKLEYLNLNDSAVAKLSDIRYLRFLPKLQELNLSIQRSEGKIKYVELIKSACKSLKYLNEEDISSIFNDSNDKTADEILANGEDSDFYEFINRKDTHVTWNEPVFIPFDDSPRPLDRESIKERLSVIEATFVCPSFATDLKYKLNSLEKQLAMLTAPPAPKNEMGETISLITPFKEGDEAILDQILDEVRMIKLQISAATKVLFSQDNAIKKIWEDLYGE